IRAGRRERLVDGRDGAVVEGLSLEAEASLDLHRSTLVDVGHAASEVDGEPLRRQRAASLGDAVEDQQDDRYESDCGCDVDEAARRAGSRPVHPTMSDPEEDSEKDPDRPDGEQRGANAEGP